MLKSTNRARRLKGFTLTEIAIVLGIMGLILGAIWTAASGVYANQRLSKASSELLTIVQNVRTIYATQTQIESSSADITSELIRAGTFPTDMLDTGDPSDASTVRSPWDNSEVVVYSVDTNYEGDSFGIVFTNVPQTACISMLTGLAGTGRDQSLVRAGAGTANSSSVPSGTTSLPITLNEANTQCDEDRDDVGFVFRLRG